jgi:hypothetical protein
MWGGIEYGAWCGELAETGKKDEAVDSDSVQSEAEDAASVLAQEHSWNIFFVVG